MPILQDRVAPGRHQLTPDQGKTWGSLTIQVGGMQLRNAAATARGALMEEAAKRLNAKKEDLKVADGVVSAGNRRVTYAAARRRQELRAQARPRQAGTAEGSEGSHHRRQVGPACRHPRQGHRALHLHAGLPRARHAAWPRGASARDGRDAAKRGRELGQGCARPGQGRARGQLPRRRGATANGARSQAASKLKATWSKWEGLPEQAKL